MKNSLIKITVLAIALSVGVTGCSTNTQEQNTVLGAGTGAILGGLAGTLAKGSGAGWVIAAGAVVGALIGGYIGNQMDSSDNQRVYVAMDSNKVYHTSSWSNSRSHMAYRVVPTSRMMTINGNPHCRTYNAYSTDSNGRTTLTQGTACRQSDNSWMQVRA